MRNRMLVLILITLPLAIGAVRPAWGQMPVELDPDCGYVFNELAEVPPGLDKMAEGMMLFLTLPGIIDTPVESWDTADLEWVDGVTYGDGIPDCYQWAMLGAVLCAGDPVTMGQFNSNVQEIDGMVAQLGAIAGTFGPIKASISPTSAAIWQWAAGLSDDALRSAAFELTYLLDDTAYDLNHDVGVYIPIVTTMLPQYTSWFAAIGGMSTAGQDTAYYAFDALLDNFLSNCSGKPISLQRLTTERDALIELKNQTVSPMEPGLAAQCNELAGRLDVAIAQILVLERPELVVYGQSAKTSAEPFSAEGDYNGDGLTNAETYALIQASGGDRFEYVRAAASENPFWDGNPALPAVGAFGMAAVAALVMGVGVWQRTRKVGDHSH